MVSTAGATDGQARTRKKGVLCPFAAPGLAPSGARAACVVSCNKRRHASGTSFFQGCACKKSCALGSDSSADRRQRQPNSKGQGQREERRDCSKSNQHPGSPLPLSVPEVYAPTHARAQESKTELVQRGEREAKRQRRAWSKRRVGEKETKRRKKKMGVDGKMRWAEAAQELDRHPQALPLPRRSIASGDQSVREDKGSVEKGSVEKRLSLMLVKYIWAWAG